MRGESPREAPAQPERIGSLDVLRGVAATYVMLFHFTYRFAVRHSELPAPVMLFPRGPLAVALFFMISGFAISLTTERRRNPLDFLAARVIRIHPTLGVCVLITALYCWLTGHPITSPLRTVANMTGIHHLFGIRHVDYSYWSLEVELLFYAAVAVVLALRTLDRLPWILAAWTLLSIGAALAAPAGAPPPLAVRLLVLPHIPYFALGVVFYRAWRGTLGPVDALLVALVALRVAVFADLVTTLATAAFAAVFFLLVRGHLRILETRPLLFLGTISYPLYLLHNAIGRWIIHDLVVRGVDVHVAIVIAITAGVLLSSAVTFWWERPVTAILRRQWRAMREG